MLIVHHFVLMIVIVPSMLCAFQQYSWKTGTNFILSEYLQTYVYIYICVCVWIYLCVHVCVCSCIFFHSANFKNQSIVVKQC